MTAFEEFGVLPELARAVDELEWTLPTDVQAEAVPLILGGGDVLMAAETGSGKTGAFCLPIIQIVWETLKDIQQGKVSTSAPTASVTSPTWTLSFFDRGEAMAITPDGLRCQSRDFKEWYGCRATKAVQGKGACYYEAIVTDEGLCRVGWSTQNASLNLGTDKFGYGFGGTGKKSNNKQFDDYGEAFGMQDVIGCLLNLNSGEIKFTKNGVDLGVAFVLNQSQRSVAYFPTVVLKNAEMQFNFGATPFKYPPPSGYTSVNDLKKESIKNNTISGSGKASASKLVNNAPQAIIIEPSRELADQTYNQIVKFKKYLEAPVVRELLVTGGINVKEQIAALNAGIDIVVGTPGRLEDLIEGGYIALTHCRFFVLDEADGLLKQGYTELIDRLHRQIPKITSDGRRLQMIVCSATLHSFEVKKMADRLMHFPTWVDLKGEDSVPETVHHCVVMVDPQKDRSWENLNKRIVTDGVHAQDNCRPGVNSAECLSEAVKLLKGSYCIKAMEEHKMDRAIIFCRTKIDCDNLENFLNKYGNSKYKCVCLHGDRAPDERKRNLQAFKDNRAQFLICTDVAARGLDITGLPFMINITLPDEQSNYVHRIGRVGRAERMGLAISLVSSVPEKVWYHGQWCRTRGKNCNNTCLTDVKGCCMWYNEPKYLGDIEEHLNITIEQVKSDMKVPINDFDGKVVYGQKKTNTGSGYKDHVGEMAHVVKQLAELESQSQMFYLSTYQAKRIK